MKSYSKIALLVALALFFTLTACERQASTPPVVSPTPQGEVPFPYTTPGTPGTTGNVNTFGTQTAIASTPANTPEVIVSTVTASAPGGQTQGGGQVTSTPQPAGSSGSSGGSSGGSSTGPLADTPVVTRPSTYVLKNGEWPICIARRFNLDIPSFFSANGLNMNSKPAAGTSLRIPGTGSWNPTYGSRSLRQHPTSYSVVAGDSVYSIACKFGDVTPEAILAVNGLANPSDVKSGMTLQIP